jgi:hypothetical protein
MVPPSKKQQRCDEEDASNDKKQTQSSTQSDKRRSDAHQSIRHLINSLPSETKQTWWTAAEISAILKEGGAPSSTDETLIASALLKCYRFGFESRREMIGGTPQKVTYYRIVTLDNETPKSQRVKNNGKLFRVSTSVPYNLFLGSNYSNHIKNILAHPHSDDSAQDDGNDKNEDDKNEDDKTESIRASGYRIVDIDLERDFFKYLFRHATSCKGHKPDLVFVRGWSSGYMSIENYTCTGCGVTIYYRTSRMVCTEVIHPGRKFSRMQPALNLEVAKSAKCGGFFPTKLNKFMSHLGCESPTLRNMKLCEQKARIAMKVVGKDCVTENQKQHVKACRLQNGYKGDLIWEDANGIEHHTSRGPLETDSVKPRRGRKRKQDIDVSDWFDKME